MRDRSWRAGLVSGVIVIMVMMTVGLGLCLAEDHEGHDHSAPHSLCATFVAVTGPSVVLGGLCLVSTVLARPGWAVMPASVAVLDPPPKPRSRA